MAAVVDLVKGIYEFGRRRYYHRLHRRRALAVLAIIEEQRGKLRRELVRCCDAYAVEVLGHRRYAPWLYVYAALSGEFREGWLPDNYYGSVVLPRINGAYATVSNLKSLHGVLFGSDSFPDLLSYVHGSFFDGSFGWVAPSAVRDVLFRDHDRVVFKPDMSGQGRGIVVLTAESFDSFDFGSCGNGSFQGYLRQHESFDQLHPNSVATIRYTTVYEPSGTVSLRGCLLRVGSADEGHVRSDCDIKLAVDRRNGALSEVGHTPDYREMTRHPVSGVPFGGGIVPAFDRCVRTVLALHRRVPCVTCIGWDVTVDADERVRVMEWNATHNGIKYHEATQGPCFADLDWHRLHGADCGPPRRLSS